MPPAREAGYTEHLSVACCYLVRRQAELGIEDYTRDSRGSKRKSAIGKHNRVTSDIVQYLEREHEQFMAPC